ncbi:MAG TPA: hypothetical protein PLB11_08255, partial [Flavobacterium sp.]|nr:hypothetical protein [Flavobacterium sp.]
VIFAVVLIIAFVCKRFKWRQRLTNKELKDFEAFLTVYSEKIVEKWIAYFIYHKEIEFEKITKKL